MYRIKFCFVVFIFSWINYSEACFGHFYGSNCDISCGHCSNFNKCDAVTGRCPGDSCEPGYKYTDRLCKSICDHGTYGRNCSQTCGLCFRRMCNHISGECSEIHIAVHNSIPGSNDSDAGLKEMAVSSSSNVVLIIALVGAFLGLAVTSVLLVIVVRRNKDGDKNIVKRVKEKRKSTEIQARRTSKVRVYTYENCQPGSRQSGAIQKRVPSKRANAQQQQYINVSLDSAKMRYSDDGGVYCGIDDDPKQEVYYNSCVFDAGIKLESFGTYITKVRDREEEFKELQKGAIHPREIGLKSENKSKNRYLTVLPYDHSIVHLEPLSQKPDTNYINANYIDSTDTEKAYIATQGPMTSTIFDFWRMVWQEKCGKIVMLTNLKEKGKNKCAKYWPDKDDTLDIGFFTVSVETEIEHLTHVERKLRVEDPVTEESRLIHHFHFTTWPDHGTPDHVQLVQFHRKVSSAKTELKGPLLVHCSAGVGRTGTFIALDALLQQAKETNNLKIVHFIKLMRKDRMNMIQTLDQYLFMHQVIYEGLKFKDTTIPKRKFAEECSKIDEETVRKVQNRLAEEFRALDEIRGALVAEPVSAKPRRKTIKDSKDSGVKQEIDPDDMKLIKIPPYGHNGGFLLAQPPLPTSENVLWNGMTSNYSAVIVTVDKITSDFIEDFIPSEDEKRAFGRMIVMNKGKKTYDIANAATIELEITNKTQSKEEKNNITVIKCCVNGKDKMTAGEISTLVGLVKDNDKGEYNGPITVLSSDGITTSSLFCAITNIIEDAIHDKTVDLFHSVRQLHIKDSRFIATKENYEFCYQAIKEFILTDTDYVNT